MKTISVAATIALACATTAFAQDDNNQAKKKEHRAETRAAAHSSGNQHQQAAHAATAQRNVTAAQAQRHAAVSAQINRRAEANQQVRTAHATRDAQIAARSDARVQAANRNAARVNRAESREVRAAQNPNVVRGPNAFNGQNVARRTTITNPRPYAEVLRSYRRDRHDRGWYREHYNTIVLYGGGYYYQNAGYWYPAWGYDNYQSNYVYDQPIYAYDGLPPGQVVANVQRELQRGGYYRSAVDGMMGPNTRQAIANFQRDRGLAVTAAIDEPTLATLGLA
jgi:hypothetical protein